MRVSTRGRYGLRTMYYLAKNFSNNPVPLSEIAQELKLSDYYLEQLIRKLRQAKLVKSIRGKNGGYTLNRAPQEIKLGDILRVLETHMAPTECCEKKAKCNELKNCPVRPVWLKVHQKIDEIIDSISLEDILNESVLNTIEKEKFI